VVGPVLAEVITSYQNKHVEVHRAYGMTDDELSDEISKLRLEIAQTEDELRIAKTNAGIISLSDAEKAYQVQQSRIYDELLQARASLAGHQNSLQELAGNVLTKGTNAGTVKVPSDKLASYKFVCARLTSLEKRQNDYAQQGFTENSKLVKENRQEMVAAAKTKIELEDQFPSLADLDTTTPPPTPDTTTPTAEDSSREVVALPLKIKELQTQFEEIQGEAAKLDEAEAKISDLERKKKQQEDNYNYFTAMLEQAHIDETLGPGRVSNINEIQKPSPPYKDYNKFYKTVAGIAFSGLLAGLAWAFLIELYLDRSVKRPVDFQNKLRIPFFLSIPDVSHHSYHPLAAPARAQLEYRNNGNGDGNGQLAVSTTLEITPPTVNDALRSHYDALRDRLVNYFEAINLTRKPKLVAVTSASKGAGVSTISAGLAASLSETGDGRVLLVDMNIENGAAQQFVHGQPSCQLDDALASEKRDHALVQENLYVVSEASNVDRLPRILPKRFQNLVPKLRASDYDYIIFDMPPVTQTSVTTRLSGFMDTVMLVVESEKTDRDVVQQAHQLLAQSKANVTAVLNKTKKYIPAKLQHDINADM
jgi:Mrp family chromosome partitioning ATPase